MNPKLSEYKVFAWIQAADKIDDLEPNSQNNI